MATPMTNSELGGFVQDAIFNAGGSVETALTVGKSTTFDFEARDGTQGTVTVEAAQRSAN